MEEAGLTDDFLNNALVFDIKHKPKNRKPELELAYKLKGKLKEQIEHSGKVAMEHSENIDNFKQVQDITLEYEEKLKKSINE